MNGVVMTPRCTRSSTASSRSGLCGALRLVASVQVGPGARLREAKCFMEVVSEGIVVSDYCESVGS